MQATSASTRTKVASERSISSILAELVKPSGAKGARRPETYFLVTQVSTLTVTHRVPLLLHLVRSTEVQVFVSPPATAFVCWGVSSFNFASSAW